SAPSRPQVPTAAPAEASVRRRSGAPWVALGALALGLLFVGWRILVRADPAPAPRVVIPEVVAEAAPPVPEPAVVRDTPPPEASLREAESAWSALAVQRFDGVMDSVALTLPCLDAVVTPSVASRYHLLQGLRLYAAGDERRAVLAFAAARWADRDATVSDAL